jgi:hypothetical protein
MKYNILLFLSVFMACQSNKTTETCIENLLEKNIQLPCYISKEISPRDPQHGRIFYDFYYEDNCIFFINTTGFYSKHIETFLDNGQWLKVQNEKYISFEGKNPENGKYWKLIKMPGRIIGYVNASEKMKIRFDLAIASFK